MKDNEKPTKRDSRLKRVKKGIFFDPVTRFYRYRFEHHGIDYEKVIGPQRQAAEIALAEAKQEVRIRLLSHNGWGSMEKLRRSKRLTTFTEAANNYIEERENYKPSSLVAYKSILKKYLLPEFGARAVKEISDSDIRKFQVRASKSISPSRVNTVMQLLRSIMGQEYKVGHIERDPSLAVKRMQQPKVQIDPLSEEELEIVLSKIDEHYKPLFTTLAFTGARPNELCALRWNDIDWNSEYLNITKGRVRGKEGLPKTKSAERKIPMTPLVVRTLQELRKRTIDSISGYVFTTPKGNPIEKHLDRVWSRALIRGGLRHRPSYQLRHTFATQCIIKGLPLPYIAKVLGHSTIESLVRNYAGWISNSTNEYDSKLKSAFNEIDSSCTELHTFPGVSPGV